jgi:hypothetical protein
MATQSEEEKGRITDPLWTLHLAQANQSIAPHASLGDDVLVQKGRSFQTSWKLAAIMIRTRAPPHERMRLSLRIREAAARAGRGTFLLFCDEAQRYNENELPDVQ